MTARHAPLGGRFISLPVVIMALFAMVAGFYLYHRFVYGLGSVTNLSDGYPWGIWIAIDLVVGTALGCAGYVMALMVYILNKGEYHPLVRPAILASLFGYGLGGIAVMIDLGRYWQGYNMMLPWLTNVNSVMLETALCIAAYITVLMIEFSPVFLERLGMTRVREKLNRFLFIIIALGVLLPTMHQSSMGTILVVLGHQLSPLWQTPLLPLFFLISALFMGFAIVIFEAVMSSVGFRRPLEGEVLGKLTGIMAWVMLGYLVLRFLDVVYRGSFGLAFDGSTQAIMFWLENLTAVIAVALVLPKANRFKPHLMFVCACMILVSGTIYRVNCYLVGYDPGDGFLYFPTVGEIMVTLGIFSLEILLYIAFVKNLPILHTPQSAYEEEHPHPAEASGSATGSAGTARPA
ncbi:MAG: Ni/Fe-hydrogenase cytochrome b subunit [Alphaproteobacteria bacterium]|jgi:Ni/Fe-hydrogenase subunit HybB-like protein|nr:Ni/Fe-hydrogenase cytochrome b subunit [Alphaproteobacteria bacterium]